MPMRVAMPRRPSAACQFRREHISNEHTFEKHAFEETCSDEHAAMNNFVGSVWWLIVSLGVLVTFHEFGHYWVARRCGVKVLRFSVGFGKALWSRMGRDGTEYMVAAIPLGGYVKMLDEREGAVAAADLPHAFNRQPVGKRIAIVIAGPLANLLLCVAMLWGMFVIG